jgi:hypothetical protein
LAIRYGCPETLSVVLGEFSHDPRASGDSRWGEAKALVFAKDPVGAALVRTSAGPFFGVVEMNGVVGLAETSDPRARERLVAWREERGGGAYWPATAALAILGDERCRAEWRAFLSEARSFLLDDLIDGRMFTRNGDPEWVGYCVSRLDANCCHAWQMHTALAQLFPTLPYDHAAGGGGRTRAGAERWFARHAGKFVWSPVLDGYVPGPAR